MLELETILKQGEKQQKKESLLKDLPQSIYDIIHNHKDFMDHGPETPKELQEKL